MELFQEPRYIGRIAEQQEVRWLCEKFGSSPLLKYFYFIQAHWGRDSSVGIATGYGLDGPGIESRWGARFFAHVQTGPGAHPASCTMGTGSFPGVKRPRLDANYPPPSSAEVKKE
jgi:hypothetical protein